MLHGSLRNAHTGRKNVTYSVLPLVLLLVLPTHNNTNGNRLVIAPALVYYDDTYIHTHPYRLKVKRRRNLKVFRLIHLSSVERNLILVSTYTLSSFTALSCNLVYLTLEYGFLVHVHVLVLKANKNVFV